MKVLLSFACLILVSGIISAQNSPSLWEAFQQFLQLLEQNGSNNPNPGSIGPGGPNGGSGGDFGPPFGRPFGQGRPNGPPFGQGRPNGGQGRPNGGPRRPRPGFGTSDGSERPPFGDNTIGQNGGLPEAPIPSLRILGLLGGHSSGGGGHGGGGGGHGGGGHGGGCKSKGKKGGGKHGKRSVELPISAYHTRTTPTTATTPSTD